METPEERRKMLQDRMNAKIASFKVGDTVAFSLEDDSHCHEGNDRTVSVDLTGTIVRIIERQAIIEHKYGSCKVHLVSCYKHPQEDNHG